MSSDEADSVEADFPVLAGGAAPFFPGLRLRANEGPVEPSPARQGDGPVPAAIGFAHQDEADEAEPEPGFQAATGPQLSFRLDAKG